MKIKNKIIIFIIFVLCTNSFVYAQKFLLDNQTSFTQVLGTSSLHDWHVQAEKQSGQIEFLDINTNQISNISFIVESESLKSGKTAMDKKTFTALKTDSFKTIDFNLLKVNSLTKKSDNVYVLNITGTLSIAGVKKTISLPIELSKKENAIILIGSYKMLLTDYNIEPPKALLGTIKTGNEIEIKFKTVYTN